jgi:hypothetical protein
MTYRRPLPRAAGAAGACHRRPRTPGRRVALHRLLQGSRGARRLHSQPNARYRREAAQPAARRPALARAAVSEPSRVVRPTSSARRRRGRQEAHRKRPPIAVGQFRALLHNGGPRQQPAAGGFGGRRARAGRLAPAARTRRPGGARRRAGRASGVPRRLGDAAARSERLASALPRVAGPRAAHAAGPRRRLRRAGQLRLQGAGVHAARVGADAAREAAGPGHRGGCHQRRRRAAGDRRRHGDSARAGGHRARRAHCCAARRAAVCLRAHANRAAARVAHRHAGVGQRRGARRGRCVPSSGAKHP